MDGAGPLDGVRVLELFADSTDHVDTFYTVITDGLTAAEKHAFAFAQKLSPSSNGG